MEGFIKGIQDIRPFVSFGRMFPDFLPYVFPKRYGRILKKICMDFNEDMYGFPGGE